MKREKIVEILKKHYSKHTVNSLLTGRRLPSFSKAIELEKEGIPLAYWKKNKAS